RRKKEEGRGKREEVLWFIFRFYLILYHLPKVILSQKEERRSFIIALALFLLRSATQTVIS
ncbi:hypothetical protein, partial [Okeania sp. SIO2C9]|uniref:hypothetical protein n=1 Tax=Okeania sp. SIO2C9 TaxID=2607791 RepID=UPI0025E0C349